MNETRATTLASLSSHLSLPHLYIIEVNEDCPPSMESLSESEVKAISFYKNRDDRLLKTCSAIFVSALGFGPLLHEDSGRPYFAHGPCISISHSYPFLAIALSDCPIGVDVERRKGWDERLDRVCFGAKEKSLGVDHLLLWTLKEATYKALGEGAFEPKSFEIDVIQNNLLIHRRKIYNYFNVSNERMILSVVSSGKLNTTIANELNSRDLAEKRRTIL